jgi:choline dehydrogenase-like flavoprotein
VTLDGEVKKQHGLPVAQVHHSDRLNDRAMRERAWQVARSRYEAAGSQRTCTRGAFSATHDMGTCRQSASQRDRICNSQGQTDDVANLFISEGRQFSSSATGIPTLMILARDIRPADFIARQMARKDL